MQGVGTIQERLKALRENKKKTQKEVSEDLDISTTALQNYEFDRTPKIKELIKFKDYYGVSYDYLIEGKNEQVENIKIGDTLGLSDNAIATLEEAYSNYYNPDTKKLNLKFYLFLVGLNSLLNDKTTGNIFYYIGLTLIAKNIEEGILKRTNIKSLGSFNYNTYIVIEKLKDNIKKIKVPNDKFYKPETMEESKQYLNLMNMSEQQILDNWKDIFSIVDDEK